MTTNDVTAIKEWEALGDKLAKRLRARLEELDEERATVAQELRRIEGPVAGGAAANGRARGRPPGRTAKRSSVAKSILQLLEEAGTAGLQAAEIIDALRTELEHVERGTVLTHLSRLKKRGVIETIGQEGAYSYRLAAAPQEAT